MQYYTQQAQNGLDADELGRRARVLHMLGEIAEERGDIGSALKLFQQASSGTAELLARDPTNPLRIFEHSQSVFWVGSVASSRGQLKLAEAQYREYQRLANELVSKGGRQSKWLAEIGYADLDLGTALLAEHRIEPAITSLEQALKLEAELVQREPGNRDRLLDYAQALAWVADANMQLGETQAALRNRQTEQTVYVRLLKAVPNDRPTVLALVVNRDKLANILLEEGQTSLAIDELDKAIFEIQPLLAADQENAGYRGAALGVYLLLGEANLRSGRLAQADAAVSSARVLLNSLVRAAPNDIEWSGTQLANLRLLTIRIAGARASNPETCRTALAPVVAESQRLRQLIKSGTAVPALARSAARSFILLGDYELASLQAGQAQAAWTDAVATIESSFAVNGSVADKEAQDLLLVAQSNARQLSVNIDIAGSVGRRTFHCASI